MKTQPPPGPFAAFAGNTALESFFGPLELQVLETLWRRGIEASVRDLQAEFASTAYTTLMTTLDRLHKKGVLKRKKSGRAFLYRPRFTREELSAALTTSAIDALLGTSDRQASARPVLSCFVEVVSQRDQVLLDELERLVREKRRALPRAGKRSAK